MNELAVKLRDAALTLEDDGVFHAAYRAAAPYAHKRRLVIYYAARRLNVSHDSESMNDQAFNEQLRRYFDDIWAMTPIDGADNKNADDPTIEFWRDDVCYPPTSRSPIAGKAFDVSFAYTDSETRCNHGRPWSGQAKSKVSDMFWSGSSLEQIAVAMGRSGGSILPKLVQLGCIKSDWACEEYVVCTRPTNPQPDSLLAEAADNIDSAIQHLSNVTNSLKEILMSKTTIIKIETKTFVNGVDISSMEDAAIYQLIATQEAEIAELEKIQTKPKKLQAEIDKRRDGIKALVDYLDSADAKV